MVIAMYGDEEIPPADRLPDVNLKEPIKIETGGPTQLENMWEEEPNLDQQVEMILAMPQLLTEDQLQDMHTILSNYIPQENTYGANFDFKAEISLQLAAVKAMRLKVFNLNGTVKDGTSLRDVKECMTAANTLTTALLKNHEKIMNFDRQRALEQATIAAIDTLDEASKQVFLNELNERLEKLE